MKKVYLLLSSFIIFFFVCFFSCQENKPLEVTGYIEGTVTDFDTREAISGVMVDIVSNSNTTFVKQSRQTGADGKFSFKDLEEGNYKLSFSRSGYNSNNIDVKVAAGQTVSSDISLQPNKNILSVTPQTLDFGETETEKSVIVLNNGLGTVPYEANTDKSWITLDNRQGSIAPNTTKIVQVTLQRVGLTPGDYTANVVINSNNTSITVPVMLKIVQPSAPVVQNGQATGITSESAQVSATIVSLGSTTVTEHGHCWSVSPNPTTSDNKTAFGSTTVTKTYISEIKGLSPSTIYYVKAYAVNNNGITYSDQISFTTSAPPTVPTVQTVRTENVKYNSIDGVGNVTNLGDGLLTDYGFCYSRTNLEPTVNDSKTSLGQTSQIGSYTVTMAGLQENIKYYVRAYAVNSRGVAYGTVLEATTAEAPPLVTSGLVAYYTFNENNCNESQGKTEYNGLAQSYPVFSTDIPGSIGKSLQLNNDTYYLINKSPFVSTVTYTINLWIKTMTNRNTIFYHQASNTPGVRIWDNIIYNVNGTSSATPSFDTSSTFNISIVNVLLDGNWHMLTITLANKIFKLYIDGTYLAERTYSSTLSANVPMQLGNGFTGNMDNLRIYNRAISQAEINQIFEAKQ